MEVHFFKFPLPELILPLNYQSKMTTRKASGMEGRRGLLEQPAERAMTIDLLQNYVVS